MKRERILEIVGKYIDGQPDDVFRPGETYVRTSGAMWDADDVKSLVDVALGRWYTDTNKGYEFERHLAVTLRQRHAVLCNSGSSANLLAVSALMSRKLGKRALKKGDEVITVAAGFPTTVNPIIQNGLVPVFADTHLPTYNALPHAVEEAVSSKTRAIFVAHTLGNPYDCLALREIADRNELWLIFDCCDALGAEFDGKPVTHFADISTFSFYPAHHISMGEGGAVTTNDPMLNKVVRSLRDWGRDCWCATGKDNTCGKRFDWQLGSLPNGFDHKYIYSEIGYNLKATDLQAALGISQLKKLPQFIESRRHAWEFYRAHFTELEKYFVLPDSQRNSNPSWFGFTLTVRENAPFNRRTLVTFLEQNKIGTRMLFGGNLTRHPAYSEVKYRVSNVLTKSDLVASNTFWLGVAPIITPRMQEYVFSKFQEFVSNLK